MKFLRHLWNIQNQTSTTKKTLKNVNASKEMSSLIKKKRRSLLKYEKYKVNYKKKIQLINLSDIITNFKNLRRNNSIK